MPIFKRNSQIRSLDEWEVMAPPKHKSQWFDGRSAKELARAWLESSDAGLPPEIAQVLATSTAFGPMQEWVAEPEVKLCFDDFKGGPRNGDLVIKANDNLGSLIIAVEGKADESFSETVRDALAAALERGLENELEWRYSDTAIGLCLVCAAPRRPFPPKAHSVSIDDCLRRSNL
jgi:hypothetical protein